MFYKKINKPFLLIALMLASNALFARGVLVVGKTYPIIEEDLLAVIYARTNDMQKNGEWQHLQKKALQTVKKNVIRPNPVPGITPTQTERAWNFDPSLSVPYDLSDTNGRVFAKAGDKLNPLDTVSLPAPLIFFDGDDKAQINCVKKLTEEHQHHVKLILVNGDVRKTANIFKRPIYFDQKGLLTSKFGITHVPAIVRQEALHLTITEVVP